MVTDKTRREAFITQNLGLVHACAGRFRGRGMEYDDLYSAGCVGLIKAYDNFDESRGVCFSTYAVPVILGEIKKLFRDGGTVKVSRSLLLVVQFMFVLLQVILIPLLLLVASKLLMKLVRPLL